jgi:hypothetical protein
VNSSRNSGNFSVVLGSCHDVVSLMTFAMAICQATQFDDQCHEGIITHPKWSGPIPRPGSGPIRTV